VTIEYSWRGVFTNPELERLHAEGFERPYAPENDWVAQTGAHSLGWVCGREGGELVGFVNVAWDGGSHAFVLDTVVSAGRRRSGIGVELVRIAAERARAAGCEWLHVDFEPHLRDFYLRACGFRPTDAGLIAL
jgi:ribosomal protein S18 acetylase RimI-like enzyme